MVTLYRFPAEMIRTTHNIVSIGLKEATSSNAQLRQQGYRRLIGAFVTLGGAEKGATLAQNFNRHNHGTSRGI